MDEYGELIVPQNSVYKDLLSLVSEHALAMPDSQNRKMLQSLIDEELKLVESTIKGSLILINAELAEIRAKHKIKPSTVTAIK